MGGLFYFIPMSLFAAAKNASPENPSTNLARPAQWLVDVLGGNKSDAGIFVNEKTSLKYSAVWNAVTILSSALSTIPVKVFRRDSKGNKIEEKNHPAAPLISLMPNEEMAGSTFKQTGMMHNLLWGNFYAGIVRNSRGDAVELILLQPSRTEIKRKGSRLVYETEVEEGNAVTKIEMKPSDVIHVPGLSTDGLKGLSVISHARNGIGLGLATEKYGAQFFGNGARPSGIIKHPGSFKDEGQKERFRKQWHELHSGDNNLKTAVLTHGMEYQAISIPPEDAQFLETRKFGVVEVARWFNLPPHMLKEMDRATFSNIEQQAIEFVVHSLRPWLVKWEEEFSRKLLRESEKRSGEWEIKFNVNALLRGSSEAQGKFIDVMIKNGVFSLNDGRKFLDMNSVEFGDRHFIQRDRMPLDRYDDFVDNTIDQANGVTNKLNGVLK